MASTSPRSKQKKAEDLLAEAFASPRIAKRPDLLGGVLRTLDSLVHDPFRITDTHKTPSLKNELFQRRTHARKVRDKIREHRPKSEMTAIHIAVMLLVPLQRFEKGFLGLQRTSEINFSPNEFYRRLNKMVQLVVRKIAREAEAEAKAETEDQTKSQPPNFANSQELSLTEHQLSPPSPGTNIENSSSFNISSSNNNSHDFNDNSNDDGNDDPNNNPDIDTDDEKELRPPPFDIRLDKQLRLFWHLLLGH
ncbi:hypothetical protein NW766_002025 [Fusarium irregulare]|uniref:Uncharacterized protein n=1 Tax=Fusarium irregulare TaxID=2494466 RepID=A0A9W8PXY0_9HYPO|nr:hypothetical protein NW766_002025 [Fusarium irregulare]